jgi:hypothetical protein
VLLFVGLDLAVTWTNYASLITLGEDYAAATTDVQRAALLAAATHAKAILESTLEAVYSIGTLSLGILIASVVMRRARFSRSAAILGVATGILGLVSVVGGAVIPALGQTVIVASLLTTAWAFVVGVRLVRLPQP